MSSLRLLLPFTLVATTTACFNPTDTQGATATEGTGSSSGTSTSASATTAETSAEGSTTATTTASTTADSSASEGSTMGDSSMGGSSGDVPGCTAPELLGSYPTASQTLAVAVWGTRAYATHTNAGLIILDLADPTNPTQIAALPLPNPSAVAVLGDDVYVGDPTGLFHIDAATTSLAGSIPGPGGRAVGGVAVVDGTVYFTDNANGDTCDACGLHIIDSELTAEQGMLALGEDPRGVAVEGDYAFVADGLGGLVVVDVSDPSSPTLAIQVLVDGWASGVSVGDGRVFVAHGGVTMFDVTQPTMPAQLTTLAGTSVFATSIAGNWLWLSDQDPGLRVVDVGDPAAPVELGALADFTAGAGVATNEDLAVVGSYEHGVRVVAQPVCG